ncbi:transcription elongation regulator 1-like [Wyeomyia smithii]|uniref:transcription elongation regulator 1-like n=1 Tax=Wyeomyia smithii TaxID=174621 RepID=UPI002467ADFD|nr:transcription elongation regulator 1-like [Wyeomyia smithii]
MHSDSDLSIKTEGHLSDKEDSSASEANGSVLLTSPTTSTASSLSQTLVTTSSTQAVPVPISSTMLSYSSAAHINSYNAAVASMHAQAQAQAQAQAVHAAHAQAAAVAQANQAAAASAQYTAHYTEAANLAKEVAQKNYANALKMAAVSGALTGKPLTALSYTGVSLNKSGLLQQNQSYLTAGATAIATPSAATTAYPPPRIGTAAMAAATPQQTLLPALTRPPPPILSQAAYTQMLRPQVPANMVTNPYAAAAAVAQQQLMSQSLMYPTFQTAGGYQFGSPIHTAIPTANLTAIPGAIPQVQQVAANSTPGSAMVLNPYKKMKTS